jgi:hypothetical protein
MVRFPAAARDIFLLQRLKNPEAIQLGPVTISQAIKKPGQGGAHPLASSAEVENPWRLTSTSLYIFTAWYLLKHSENFSFASQQRKYKLNFGVYKVSESITANFCMPCCSLMAVTNLKPLPEQSNSTVTATIAGRKHMKTSGVF